jgi:hypothetical protein
MHHVNAKRYDACGLYIYWNTPHTCVEQVGVGATLHTFIQEAPSWCIDRVTDRQSEVPRGLPSVSPELHCTFKYATTAFQILTYLPTILIPSHLILRFITADDKTGC